MGALCPLPMRISVLEFFGCKQQKEVLANLRRGKKKKKKDRGRFSFEKSAQQDRPQRGSQHPGGKKTQTLVAVLLLEGVSSAPLSNQSLTVPSLDLEPTAQLGEAAAP